MRTIIVYVSNLGFCDFYDISTYEQLQEAFGNIISSLGGDSTKTNGMKKISELTDILECEYNIFISMDKLNKGKHGYITMKEDSFFENI